jgi:von Willebrand factor A domain-containing protein 7
MTARLGPVALAALAAVLVPAAARAQDQQPRERPGWPCVGRPDPVYVRTAEATGGQVFLFDKSEMGQSAALMIATSRNEETIFRVSGSLEEGLHEFSFPVDSTLESVLISVSLQCLQTADVTTPAGSELRANDTGVDYHQFEAGRIITVGTPQPGSWKVTVSGRGLFFLVVQGRTGLSLDTARFVAPGGRPGHEGLFPVKGPLPPGSPRLLEVGLHGQTRAVAFQFVSSQGQVLQSLGLAPEEGGSDDDRTYVGRVTPTARDYRLQVTGTDARGFPFSRMHAPLFSEALP